MSRGDEPNADPGGSPQAELAAVLTGLRAQLDAAIRDFEAVRSEAEAKVLALHSHLKEISAGMHALEATISSLVTASEETPAETETVEPGGETHTETVDAGDREPAVVTGMTAENEAVDDTELHVESVDEERAEASDRTTSEAADEEATEAAADVERAGGYKESGDVAAATESQATETAQAPDEETTEGADMVPVLAADADTGVSDDSAGAEGASEYKLVAGHVTRKEPATAADIAAAMLADLALELPAGRATSDPLVALVNEGQPAVGSLRSDPPTQSTTSSSEDAILKQEFAEYFESPTGPLPASGPLAQPEDAEKVTTDEWA